MGAERAAAEGWSLAPSPSDFVQFLTSVKELESFRWDDFRNVDNLGDENLSDNSCSDGVECYFRYVEVGGAYYILAMGAVGDGGVVASEMVTVKVTNPGLMASSAEAALTCLGESCSLVLPPGRSGSAIDGRNYNEDGSTTGANRPEEDEGGVAAALFSHGVFNASQDCSSNPGPSVCGSRENRHTYESYTATGSTWQEAEEHISNDMASVKSYVLSSLESGSVQYIGNGEESSPAIDKGVIFVEGGTLSWAGGSRFKGLVFVDNGLLELGGTAAVLGAVISRSSEIKMGGNAVILYSSEAIESALGSDSSGVGTGGMKIEEWR